MKNFMIILFLNIAIFASQLVYAQYNYVSKYPRGTIHRAYVKYKDNDTVTITTGYGECCNKYWEIGSETDHDMTGLASGEDFHYIYIDDSASSYPTPIIIDSTSEPSWSDSKQGWYNDDDRCIGVVWSPVDSATIHTFFSDDEGRYFMFIKQLLSDGHADGTSQSFSGITESDYWPKNMCALNLRIRNLTQNNYASVAVGAASGATSGMVSEGWILTHSTGWLYFPPGFSGELSWWGNGAPNDSISVVLYGYKINR